VTFSCRLKYRPLDIAFPSRHPRGLYFVRGGKPSPVGGAWGVAVTERVERWERINFTGDLRRFGFFFFEARDVAPSSHRRISRPSERCSLITKNYAATLLERRRRAPRSQLTRLTIAVRDVPLTGRPRTPRGRRVLSLLLDLTRFHNPPSRSRGDKRIAVSLATDAFERAGWSLRDRPQNKRFDLSHFGSRQIATRG